MADSRFFRVAGKLSLGELAHRCGAELTAEANPDQVFSDVAPLDTAGSDHVSFLDNRKYIDSFRSSSAGACIVHPDMADQAPPGMQLLISGYPYKAYALVAQAFYPRPTVEASIAPTATVDGTAIIGEGVRIEAGAVIGPRAEIGRGCLIAPNAVIGEAVVVGEDSIVGANATLSHCLVGARVNIYPGACIGQRGFGFAIDPAGHVKVPQLGRVIIEDDVEVGANTTIDRGTGPDTVIGAGSMIDNLVQIGHNVRLGKVCVIAAQVGMSGSTVLGDLVIMGGQGGIAGHLKIGSGVQIAAQSGILKSIEPGEKVMGTPAKPLKQFFREIAILGRLAKKGKGTQQDDG
ncbi:MAG: UDP-3-O-(3-hydroxymyristoyl)glucosamine N-acyltransferase [Alphaproteobacteria bacterium]|nr:UDP-3-O-(3-hydroxymyristoyl)glucosamine N-acyltransferase [Alphaproteobacteria bacterium]